MTLTAEQSRAFIEAIVTAPSIDALHVLHRQARHECGLDIRGSFLELLIEVTQEKLARRASKGGRERIA